MSSNRIRVRIKFSKHGVMRFIGHLDIMRYFQKVFRRAEIDISYSQGFSPHQIMSFAAPLGVGMESDGEYMDVELESIKSSAEIVSKMNEQMADGMKVISAKIMPLQAPNAMACVAAAGYYITLRDGFEPQIGWRQAISDFMSQEKILVTKVTKKNEIQMDIKPGIYEFKVSSYDCADCLYLMVNASSSGNIKPSMVMDAFYRYMGFSLDIGNLFITREDTYLNRGTEDLPEFCPLDYLGEVKEVE